MQRETKPLTSHTPVMRLEATARPYSGQWDRNVDVSFLWLKDKQYQSDPEGEHIEGFYSDYTARCDLEGLTIHGWLDADQYTRQEKQGTRENVRVYGHKLIYRDSAIDLERCERMLPTLRYVEKQLETYRSKGISLSDFATYTCAVADALKVKEFLRGAQPGDADWRIIRGGWVKQPITALAWEVSKIVEQYKTDRFGAVEPANV